MFDILHIYTYITRDVLVMYVRYAKCTSYNMCNSEHASLAGASSGFSAPTQAGQPSGACGLAQGVSGS